MQTLNAQKRFYMDNFTSIDIDDIVKSSIDDLAKILKVKSKLYIGYDNKQNVAIAKICTAMNQIVYEKGYKRGKSVGSHQAYNHFLKQGHWEDEIPYDPVKHGHWINIDAKFENMYVAHQCSICKSEFLGDASNFCPRCGARMDGE